MKRVITSAVFVSAFVSLLVLGLVSRVQAECSNASKKGTYGFTCQGTMDGSPVALVGTCTFDGKGHGTAKFVASGTDTIPPEEVHVTLTYTVNSDCTGIDENTFPDGSKNYTYFVIDNHTQELRDILIVPGDTGTIVACVQRKL